MKHSKEVIKLFGVITVSVAMLVAVAVPNKVIEEDYSYIDIANSRVFTYKYGLALYEKTTRQFYNVSPFDMYYTPPETSVFKKYVDPTQDKSTLFSWSDNIVTAESTYLNIIKKLYRIQSYFDLSSPTATFTKNNETVKIAVKKSAPNVITFYLDLKGRQVQNDPEMSFTLNGEDILIDDKNTIYQAYESSKTTDYLAVKNITGYELKTYDDIPYQMSTKYFIVTNHNMTGYYKVYFDKGTVFTNLQAKKLNFIVDKRSPSFNVEVGEYLSQVLNNYDNL